MTTEKEAQDWEDARDAAVLSRLKRKPQTFEELQLETGLYVPPLRESLYRLTTSGAADYDYDREGWTLPVRRRRMTKADAISVLMDAGQNWANELTEYIIPADDRYDTEEWVENMSTTASRKATVDEIHEAIKLLIPKKREAQQ